MPVPTLTPPTTPASAPAPPLVGPPASLAGSPPPPPGAPAPAPTPGLPEALILQAMGQPVQPAPAAPQPPSIADLTKKYGLWKGFAEKIQKDPSFFQGLLTFGAIMMSPHAPGTGAYSNLGAAVLGAQKAYNSSKQQITGNVQRQQALGTQAYGAQTARIVPLLHMLQPSGSGAHTPAQIQVFDYLSKQGNLDKKDRENAARVMLGLVSKASQSRIVDINGVPTFTATIDGQPIQIPMTTLLKESTGKKTLASAGAEGAQLGKAKGATEASYTVPPTKEEKVKAGTLYLTRVQQIAAAKRNVARAISQVNDTTAGIGSLLSGIAGTPAHNLMQTLQSVAAGEVQTQIQNLKAMTKTATAGVGRVLKAEIELWQNIYANIEKTQGPEQLRTNLGEINKMLDETKQRITWAYQQMYGKPPALPGAAPASASGEAPASGPVNLSVKQISGMNKAQLQILAKYNANLNPAQRDAAHARWEELNAGGSNGGQ